jgi:hypothetical protein
LKRPLVRKLGAPFALAYLLAGWLGAALHSHVHVHGESTSAHEAGGTSQHSARRHAASESTHDGEESPAEHDEGDDHCLICENLAKLPLPVAVVELQVAIEPAVACLEPIAPLIDGRVPPATQSRGPPLA